MLFGNCKHVNLKGSKKAKHSLNGFFLISVEVCQIWVVIYGVRYQSAKNPLVALQMRYLLIFSIFPIFEKICRQKKYSTHYSVDIVTIAIKGWKVDKSFVASEFFDFCSDFSQIGNDVGSQRLK